MLHRYEIEFLSKLFRNISQIFYVLIWDDDVLHSGQHPQALFHFAFQVKRDLGIVGREREAHLDGAVNPGGGTDQAERHDVATESRVLDLLEMVFDRFGSHGEKVFGNGEVLTLLWRRRV